MRHPKVTHDRVHLGAAHHVIRLSDVKSGYHKRRGTLQDRGHRGKGSGTGPARAKAMLFRTKDRRERGGQPAHKNAHKQPIPHRGDTNGPQVLWAIRWTVRTHSTFRNSSEQGRQETRMGPMSKQTLQLSRQVCSNSINGQKAHKHPNIDSKRPGGRLGMHAKSSRTNLGHLQRRSKRCLQRCRKGLEVGQELWWHLPSAVGVRCTK